MAPMLSHAWARPPAVHGSCTALTMLLPSKALSLAVVVVSVGSIGCGRLKPKYTSDVPDLPRHSGCAVRPSEVRVRSNGSRASRKLRLPKKCAVGDGSLATGGTNGAAPLVSVRVTPKPDVTLRSSLIARPLPRAKYRKVGMIRSDDVLVGPKTYDSIVCGWVDGHADCRASSQGWQVLEMLQDQIRDRAAAVGADVALIQCFGANDCEPGLRVWCEARAFLSRDLQRVCKAR